MNELCGSSDYHASMIAYFVKKKKIHNWHFVKYNKIEINNLYLKLADMKFDFKMISCIESISIIDYDR